MSKESETGRLKILVTGASGLLGRTLVRRLAAGHDVVGISKSGLLDTQVCDLCDPAGAAALFRRHAFELVIHAAAFSDVDGCERDPGLAHASNALATEGLARACGEKRIPLIYVSTDYVFDGKKNIPYAESDPVCPINVYGMTKLEGEFFARQYPLHSAIVRTSWLFGSGVSRNFVNAVVHRLKTQASVGVLADQEDSPTYAEDLSQALAAIARHLVGAARNRPEEKFFELFHFCNAGSTTRYGMTCLIRDVLRLKDVRVHRVDTKDIRERSALRPAYAVMSTEHYRTVFGADIRSWQEALKAYLLEAGRCGF